MAHCVSVVFSFWFLHEIFVFVGPKEPGHTIHRYYLPVL